VLDPGDSFEEHIADTLAAGAGLCDADAVAVLVRDGARRVRELMELGARFDRRADGRLSMAREGGHGRARIVHAGGAATGLEVERALVAAVGATPVTVFENAFAVDLLAEEGRCAGAVVREADGTLATVRAANTLLAAGGSGQLFEVTTNPMVGTGDGIAMALRAGAAVTDLEFVQFHPTGLHHPVMPRPLLSEAMRGHGALLVDDDGRRFVDELQPRDIVARAITQRMLEQDVGHVWLDATHIDDVAERFPSIALALAEVGLDPRRDLIPVAPAAHYHCGGVVTDLDGATSLPGLWAAGEVAAAGVHGANRLASNSLLDGLVFGNRVVDALLDGRSGPRPTGVMRGLGGDDDIEIPLVELAEDPLTFAGDQLVPAQAGRERLQHEMTRLAGVIRTEDSLAEAQAVVRSVAASTRTGTGTDSGGVAELELRNLCTVANGLLSAARMRRETRGAHSREEFPERDPAQRLRYVHRGDGEEPS
jgi:L-aspartate oxidase